MTKKLRHETCRVEQAGLSVIRVGAPDALGRRVGGTVMHGRLDRRKAVGYPPVAYEASKPLRHILAHEVGRRPRDRYVVSALLFFYRLV